MFHMPDLINGLFEFIGGLLSFTNVYRLWKDKSLKGVYYIPTAFFAAWGAWNLYYYPYLQQWLSFTGGLVIVAANVAWVSLAIKYRNNK